MAWHPIFKRRRRKKGIEDERTLGEIYLLHFDRPYKHARHYMGWALIAADRIAEHRNGNGSNLMAVLKTIGIGFQIAWIKPGTRLDERKLKNRGGSARQCPICLQKEDNNAHTGIDC